MNLVRQIVVSFSVVKHDILVDHLIAVGESTWMRFRNQKHSGHCVAMEFKIYLIYRQVLKQFIKYGPTFHT